MKIPESNEQLIARKEIKFALENLMQVCKRNHAAFLGYIYSDDPLMIVRFGNVNQTGPAFTALLQKLEDISEQKRAVGLFIEDPLTDPS